jgi:hypothetical protein
MKNKVYKHITIYNDETQTHNDKSFYVVINTKNEDILGYIYYEPKWNQYVFQAEPEIIFSVSCLKDIIDFIENEIKE